MTQLLLMESAPLDKTTVAQKLLDIEDRGRTNPFPWRGQFSPQLVEALLASFATTGDFILDPFAGSGTTLFEAARKNLAAFGTEINPAAIAMADTVRFLSAPVAARHDKFRKAWSFIVRGIGETDSPQIPELLAGLVNEFEKDKLFKNIFINTLIRFHDGKEGGFGKLKRAFDQHHAATLALPVTPARCEIRMADARDISLPEGKINLVITSPPYINVFNYHQNNRVAMELLGWELLAVAKSEFGANRKNRGNRFLTVIQYCLDIGETFQELRRVVNPKGRLIFVIGRESTVRGVPFRNGSLVASVAAACGYRLVLRQERKFTNMFGALIFEDILHFERNPGAAIYGAEELRKIGVEALENALRANPKSDVMADLEQAISHAAGVESSPRLQAQDNYAPITNASS